MTPASKPGCCSPCMTPPHCLVIRVKDRFQHVAMDKPLLIDYCLHVGRQCMALAVHIACKRGVHARVLPPGDGRRADGGAATLAVPIAHEGGSMRG